jgi:hypothetical protein
MRRLFSFHPHRRNMKVHETATRRLAAVALVFSALAAGCGGGGGGLPPSPPAPAPAPAPLSFGTFPSAAAVIGQTSSDQVAPDGTPGTLSFPGGEPAVSADGRLFVPDYGTNTLKVFSRHDQHGAFMDFPGVTSPRSVSIQSGRLVVVDGGTVRIFESATPGAAQIAEAGSGPVCNASGLVSPTSAHLTPTGRLVVADSGNNRVLIWNDVSSPILGDADVVVGQRNMISCAANAGGASPGSETLNAPEGVWSDGSRLLVADRGNHRVLVWESLPSTDFQPASTVLGQGGPNDGQPNAGGPTPSPIGLDSPVAVDVSEAGQLAVSDRQNHRVMIWNRFPAAGAHGQPADQVIGKSGFTSSEALPVSGRTLDEPLGVRFHGTDLIVVDNENSRVMVWRGTAPPVTPPPVQPTPALPFPNESMDPPGPGLGAY